MLTIKRRSSLLNVPGVGVEKAFVGMGSSVCSRNSRMCGLMMVSSGMLCTVIQANSAAFLDAILRSGPRGGNGIACGDVASSARVLDS